MPDFSSNYSDDSFWEKLRRHAASIGKDLAEKALILYYCLQDSDTPLKARATILSSLGYLILPLDAIPDIVPVAGFTDDLGVLAAAIAIVALHIKGEHIQRAKSRVQEWFDA